MPSAALKYYHLQPTWPAGEAPAPPAAEAGAPIPPWLLDMVTPQKDYLQSPTFVLKVKVPLARKVEMRMKQSLAERARVGLVLKSEHHGKIRLAERFRSRAVKTTVLDQDEEN